MEYRKLGDTDLQLSLICLGTMTWGEQNSESEAFEQMDYALTQGVNFFDTAEIYPVPMSADTYGDTERIIGRWLKKRGTRNEVCLATKVSGPSTWTTFVRGGPRLTKEQVSLALEKSLERLGTEYVDLYQVHWPARTSNFFGTLCYPYSEDEQADPLEETLEALADAVSQGKVRHIGIANETAWGVASYLRLSEQRGWPRVVSIQNPYNLLNRSFEVGLAEFAHREKTGLLAYSPLGFGVLTGKYLQDQKPKDARLTLHPHFQRYLGANSIAATEQYVRIAKDAGLSPAQLALAWVNGRKFLTSTIVGATTMEQLRDNIGTADIKLDQELIEKIEAVHTSFPFPAP